jgi:hypothetical protein
LCSESRSRQLATQPHFRNEISFCKSILQKMQASDCQVLPFRALYFFVPLTSTRPAFGKVADDGAIIVMSSRTICAGCAVPNASEANGQQSSLSREFYLDRKQTFVKRLSGAATNSVFGSCNPWGLT